MTGYELFEASDYYILLSSKDGSSLWCDRGSGRLQIKSSSSLETAWNPVCLGFVDCFIGKIRVQQDGVSYLLLVKESCEVPYVNPKGKVYNIKKVVMLPLSSENAQNLQLRKCKTHHSGIKEGKADFRNAPHTFNKTWSSIKSAAESVKSKKRDKDKEKFEKRIQEEIYKVFSEAGGFYYSFDVDLTSSVQKQSSDSYCQDQPLWIRADERFFWNNYLLEELIETQDPTSHAWIVPIIQGFMQTVQCPLKFNEEMDEFEIRNPSTLEYHLTVISRRSRYRAGTRYKRRGVDDEGHCANYVETEQILRYSDHVASFVQLRASVPLYWSQTGIKYKPPPRIEKDRKENHSAFVSHLNSQLELYPEGITIVSLLDLRGKEKVVADEFLHHVLLFNSSKVTFIAFDFHDYCRGMRFENVSVLTDNILDLVKAMCYCWIDSTGVICTQKGIFRVNCLDCLDRTNVVQSALARIVLEIQCRKLALLPPNESLPLNCRNLYQQLWANNGDAISHQYAGTAALKGDYTRTGERRFAGLMKDGVNSANRYLINKIKDVYKQTAIDLLLGNSLTEDLRQLGAASNKEGETEVMERELNLKALIDDCKHMVIAEPEHCLGGWGLIDCDVDTGDPDQQDMDVLLLLSQQAYYVARYDDDKDQITSYEKISLENLERIQIGHLPGKLKVICIRLHFHNGEESGFHHTFRTTNIRLFNNIIIEITNEEESRESLKAIYESIAAAKGVMEQDLPPLDSKLDKKKSKHHRNVIDIASQAQQKAQTLSGNTLVAVGSEVTDSNEFYTIQSTHESSSTKHAAPSAHHVSSTGRSVIPKVTATIGRTFAKLATKRNKIPDIFQNIVYIKADAKAMEDSKTHVYVEAPESVIQRETQQKETPDLISFGSAVESHMDASPKLVLEIMDQHVSHEDLSYKCPQGQELPQGHECHVYLECPEDIQVPKQDEQNKKQLAFQEMSDTACFRRSVSLDRIYNEGGNEDLLKIPSAQHSHLNRSDPTFTLGVDIDAAKSRVTSSTTQNESMHVPSDLLHIPLPMKQSHSEGFLQTSLGMAAPEASFSAFRDRMTALGFPSTSSATHKRALEERAFFNRNKCKETYKNKATEVIIL